MNPLATVDVVIVNWNTGDYLRACVASLACATHEAARIDRVIVVDNASIDGSLDGIEAVAGALEVNVVHNEVNAGFAAACNQGAAGSAADYLLFLNPDATVLPGTLDAAVAFMAHPDASDVGICGVRVVDERGAETVSSSRFPTLRVMIGKATGLSRVAPRLFPSHHLTPAEMARGGFVDQVIGAFFLIRRPLFELLHGFDERYFLYYEEVDLSLRARELGARSYRLGDARIVHAENVSANKAGAARLYHSTRSRTLYARRHWPRWQVMVLLAVTLGVELPARLLRAAAGGHRGELSEVVAGYRLFVHELLDGRLDRDPSPAPSATGSRVSAATKRALDLGVCLAAIPIVGPLILVVAGAVRLSSGPPVLYRSVRMGRGQRPFTMLKFRTMRADPPVAAVTSAADPRITRLGRWLRHWKLDELPQLFNVLTGDMSLVGPRPEDPRFLSAYSPEERQVFLVRPGITGPAALQYRNEEQLLAAAGTADVDDHYVREVLHDKLAIDLDYVRNRTLRGDVRILLQTATALWR